MKFKSFQLPGVKLIEPDIHYDSRGYFFEAYRYDKFLKRELSMNFLQDNEVFSSKNVLRGLHYQLKNPQGKLIRCIRGTILDVAVDIRVDSPTFGKWLSFQLSDKNKNILYVPEGFAHGYLVKSENSIVSYKCTNFHDKNDEYGIRWDDSDLKINWGCSKPIVSDRDRNMPLLKNQKFLPKH